MFFSGAYILSTKPWVMAVADNSLASVIKITRRAGINAHFLVFRTWFGGDLKGALSAVRLFAKSGFPRMTWMCNATAEVSMLRIFAQRAIFCHHNLFCNENTVLHQSLPIAFDAIYIARLDPYKRLWLARNIQKLRIVAANPQDKSRLVTWGCSHASVNSQYQNFQTTAEDICKSNYGLALSKKEGGMLAVTEYLLCGKPVVTTPSRGGREHWLDAENHLVVADDPVAIAEAVNGINYHRWNPHAIRNSTLIRLKHQRQILAEYVHRLGVCHRQLSADQVNGDWLHGKYVHHSELARILSQTSFSS